MGAFTCPRRRQGEIRLDLTEVRQGCSKEAADAASPVYEVELEWCGGRPRVPSEAAGRMLRRVRGAVTDGVGTWRRTRGLWRSQVDELVNLEADGLAKSRLLAASSGGAAGGGGGGGSGAGAAAGAGGGASDAAVRPTLAGATPDAAASAKRPRDDEAAASVPAAARARPSG